MYAGFWKRFFAYFIDGAILFTSLLIARRLIIFIAAPVVAAGSDSVSMFFRIVNYIINIAGSLMYYALFESSSRQATPGKMAVDIIVTDLEGHRLTFGKAAKRWLFKVISGFILNIGFIMAAFTKRKQALHDIIMGTLVLNKSYSPVEINDKEIQAAETREVEQTLDGM